MTKIKDIDGMEVNGLTIKADSDSMLNKALTADEAYLIGYYINRYKRFLETTVVFPISERYLIDFIGHETHKDVLIRKNTLK
jgi:hypothetical protein